MIRAKSFTDSQVREAIEAGQTVVVCDSGSHGDDDLFLGVDLEEAIAMMEEYLEADLPEDYEFHVADDGELRAILWNLRDVTDLDEVEELMDRRAAALAAE